MTEEYLKAQKKGLSQYRKDLSAGRYPYPVSLDDLLPQAKRRGTESVGQMEIPLADVAGTVQHARQDAFSRAFYPLLEEGTEFSAKWIALYQSQLKEGIRDPVRVIEYLKRFYVLEGNKRVSVSRFVGAVSVMADITRILPLREDEENAWYEEFLRFFAATRTYEIDCRKEGGYEKITRAFGMELTAPCDRESLTVLLSAYRRFEACLRTRLIGEEAVCAGDAFGVYLDIYGSGDLLSLNEGALSARLEKLRAEIRLLLSDDIAYVEMPAGEAADTPHSLFSIFRNKPLYSGEHPLKAAMIHGHRRTAAGGCRMKILAVSDKEKDTLWQFYDPSVVKDVSLILSCGDLDPAYLEFLVTMVNCPLLYVRGNHDGIYDQRPPEGCENIDGRVVTCEGLSILGLGGSMRYKDAKDMYTEEEMAGRIRKMRRAIKKAGTVDVVAAHAPVKGYGDLADRAHTGFQCFDDLLTKLRPQVFVHGHVHAEYGRDFRKEMRHPSGTRILNVYGCQLFDIVPRAQEGGIRS